MERGSRTFPSVVAQLRDHRQRQFSASCGGSSRPLFSYNAQANDPDHDVLIWTLDQAPWGMSIDNTRGTLRWVPDAIQVGTQTVAIRVRDPFGAFALQTFNLAVGSGNLPSLITSSPETQGTTQRAYSYKVAAIDPENDPLTFSLTSPPSGMTIDPFTGVINWTPAQTGSFNIAISVNDGQGGLAAKTQSFTDGRPLSTNRPRPLPRPRHFAPTSSVYRCQVTADPNGDFLAYSLVARGADNKLAGPGSMDPPSTAGTYSATVSVST